MSDTQTEATSQDTTKDAANEIANALYPEAKVEDVKAEQNIKAEGTQEKPEEKAAEGEVKEDLILPEETLLEESEIEQLKSLAKEQGFSTEQAQKVLDMQNNIVSAYNQRIMDNFNNQVKSWGEEIKADKEIGGSNLAKSVELAKFAAKEFAGEEFLQELDQTGYGNHPKLFKMLVKVGMEMKAKEAILPQTQPSEQRSLADIFYSNSNN